MRLITVIVLCLVPIVWGQILNQGDGTLQVHSKVILDLQLRLSVVERLRDEDALRIADLSRQQQNIDQRRIAELEKQQQMDRMLISELVNKRDEDFRTIADLVQKQQDDHDRIDDLEKRLHYDTQRIADLEKRSIADQETNIRDSDQHLFTNPQKQERRQILNIHYKSPFNSSTNNTTTLVERRGIPSVRKTKSFGTNSSHSEIPSAAFETSDKWIKKRVSQENDGMVAFYAVLSHNYSPVTNIMEIHFDNVITNIGASYNGNTGTFTCKNAGVYVFSFTVHIDTRYMYTEVVKNGAVIGTAFSGDSQYSITGTRSLVVHLDQGDNVWVRVKSAYPGITIAGVLGTTVFSGFLLR